MSWNRQTFEPPRPPPRYADRYRFPSPPLCRLGAAIGFTAGGLLVLYGAGAVLGVEHDFMRSGEGLGIREVVVLGGSLLAGLLCGLLGFGLGLAISVRSEKINHILAVFWHYLANGSILWFFLVYLVLIKIFGQEGIKQHVDQLGIWYSSFSVAGTGAVGSLASAALLLLVGQVSYGRKPRLFLCLILILPVSMAMGYVQFRLLDASTAYWLIPSVVFPLALIPLSAMMVARDYHQRRQMLSVNRG